MIFESLRMQELLKTYEKQPDFMVPEIVYFARSERLADYRTYFEEIFVRAPEAKQKDWLGRLQTESHDQYRGAWFEIMLYGWLLETGPVQVEPIIEGNLPDFALLINGQEVCLEGRAFLETDAQRNKRRFELGIHYVLKQIKKPFDIKIDAARTSQMPDWADFQRKVEAWLDESPDEMFEFNDGTTVIVLNTMKIVGRKQASVIAFGPIETVSITGVPLKKPLHEKAHQHKALRHALHPYVIALLIESSFLSAEEVVKAWLGEEKWIVDFEKGEVVESFSDQSGLHFVGTEIRHTTVSGTLIFKSQWDESKQRDILIASYMENPFAKVPLDTSIFPVDQKYVVMEKSAKGFGMAWLKCGE